MPVVLQQGGDAVALVEALDPLGQLLHVVAAGDEVPRSIVQPVGPVGRVACGQDGGAVLDGYAYGLAAEVGGDAQLVGDGRREEVAGRHLPALAVGRADGGHATILRAVDRGVVLDEVIARDAVDGRYAARMYGAMPDGGDAGQVVDAGVLAVEALGK